LLATLQIAPDAARVDPSRTLIAVGPSLWTLVAVRPAASVGMASSRRAGAKHKQVRN